MTQLLEWAVVGAGPAGIASIGNLLDAGVKPAEIAWIDPQFKVGDFGTAWRYVSSNTPIELFIKFYQRCETFRYLDSDHPSFMVDKLPPQASCPLMIAAEPLHWITKSLRDTVNAIQDEVRCLTPVKNFWQLKLASEKMLNAKKIVLAIGSDAKQLNFLDIPSIPLKTALDPAQLKSVIQPDDNVMVFGSAQSAKSVVENLSKVKTKKSVLFYRSENSFERHFREADLSSIESLAMTSRNLLAHMPHCTKAIYAVGFERRHIPIAGLAVDYDYDHKTGEIAPGVFGLGIAFPEIWPYELGQREYRVSAIWPFMKRLKKLLPHWLS
ncbi:MAG: FAD/NAD(P)-binding protein [Pseudomonadota bacterium]